MNPILRFMKKSYSEPKLLSASHDRLSLWKAMYENNAPWHTDEVTGLSLASAISGELARLTTIEMNSKISGSKRADFLNKPYQNILSRARVFTELACAMGSIILKPYIKNGEIYVDFIKPEDFLPVSFDDDGNLTGAIFLDRIFEDDLVYTRLEEHRLSDKYIIKNKAYKSSSRNELGREIPLNHVKNWENLEEYTEISGIKKPLFSHFKMPSADIYNTYSPMGVSVFDRACNLIKDADIQYSRLLWEFESGKRALFVDESAITRDKLGRKIIPDTRLYRMLNTEDDTLFKDWTPNIRNKELSDGLNRILRCIEFSSGLAYGTLSDAQLSDKTAEEIRSSKQRSYSTVSDIQRSLKTALTDLIYAMDKWVSIYNLAPDGDYSVSFDFDDSIITDRAREFDEKKQLLELGIIKPVEFRMWYFGECEAEATKKLAGEN